MPRQQLEIDQGIQPLVTLGWLEAAPCRISDPASLDREIDEAAATLRAQFGGLTAGQIPHLQPARTLYRAFGLDPTRLRPSPEALLRRVLRGDPFPRNHPAVDLANLWAILHGLPVGLYDLDKLRGTTIVARRGAAGDEYPGIRKDTIRLEGRLLLADDAGPFGNPSADSLRTAVDDATAALLFVVFAPADHPRDELGRWLDWLAERVARHFGAAPTHALVRS